MTNRSTDYPPPNPRQPCSAEASRRRAGDISLGHPRAFPFLYLHKLLRCSVFFIERYCEVTLHHVPLPRGIKGEETPHSCISLNHHSNFISVFPLSCVS